MENKQNGYLQASNGDKSSKRLWGSILCANAIIIGNAMAVYCLFRAVGDSKTVIEVVKLFLISGVSLLGIGVTEDAIKFIKNKNI